ncbi:MAG TPA: phenylalanine--tRNA ligase subunit beta [Planctomycetaceae bacterium]|jgi:phenylalanyl-tRNA synthetase beta chain|nr:phenylalanine--tRNA ligase subunit beta [Planctomycetaceae bacterium]
MIVSWEWLRNYVPLQAPLEDAVRRLTMAGLKVESQKPAGTDWAIDVEVTSNRPDCLGHLGIARELSVLFGQPLTIPPATPAEGAAKTAETTSVVVECPELCPQYFARVIRGVKVGPSPAWLARRLEAIGQPSINNVVDVTNYVLMECGQPLHAFDFDRLRGQRIVVRRGRPGEKIIAINQKTYDLSPEMCVIADAERPVAIGGVMGGLETEIGPTARNVLIEAANFTPLPLRNTARKLLLFSDSSYRFERGIDPQQLDWASRRACHLILELAGGELLAQPVMAGTPLPGKRPPITLRFAQIPRVLGIEVPQPETVRILAALGAEPDGPSSDATAQFVPPSWRRDVSREIDLIEEVARIHGYDAIPQDVDVPLRASHRSLRDRVTDAARFVFTAGGFYEAVTMAFCSDAECALFQPRGELPRLRVEHSSRKQENVLRQSLVPGLLASRQLNQRHGTFDADLFEIAKVYLKTSFEEPEARREPPMIGFVTGRPFSDAKGIIDALAHRIVPHGSVTVKPSDVRQFAPGRGADIYLNGTLWGWLGELDRSVTDTIDLKDAVTVGELELSLLEANAALVPKNTPLAQFPAIDRDLNFVLDEGVTWEALESVVSASAGPLLERVGFGGQYRGKQIEAEKKSYVVTLSYRAADRTLTADEVDGWQKQVIETCGARLGARLR